MTKRIFVLLITLLLPLIIFGLEISGVVLTAEDKPLDNVFIIWGKKQTKSDNSGRFQLSGGSPTEPIKLHRTGYEPLQLKYSDFTPNQRIVLKRAPITIPGDVIRSNRGRFDIKTPERVEIVVDDTKSLYDLAELLKSVPEVKIVGTDLVGEKKTVAILGHHPRHTLVLLDGVPLNSSGQAYDISQIPVHSIESIEVIKGASPKGSGALGGIVSIKTKGSAEKFGLDLGQSFGSFETYKSYASIKQRNRYFSFNLYVDSNRAKNDFSYLDRKGVKKRREYNDKASQNLQLRLSAIINSKFNSTYRLEIQNFAHKLPGPLNYEALYRDARLEGGALKQSFLLTYLWEDGGLDLTLYQHRQYSDYDNTRAPYPFYHLKSEHRQAKRGGILNGTYGVGQLSLESSVEYQREDFSYKEIKSVESSIPSKYVENYAWTGEIEYLLPLKSIDSFQTLSFREDYSKKWKDNLSYGYDLHFKMYYPVELTLGAGIGSNFSYPSFYDLYWKGDFQTTGNPDLKGETALHKKVYGEINYYPLTFGIEYNQSSIDDLIYWYRSIIGWKPGNVAKANIENFSLKGGYRLNSLVELSATYLITDAENRSLKEDGSHSDLYGKKIVYTPEETLQAELNLTYSNYWLKLSHRYTGEQWTTLDQLIEPLKGYYLTDLEIGGAIPYKNQEYRLSVQLNNLFNHRYEIYHYTPQPGFNWLLNLQYNYKK
ncbi:MAG: TonB-dependent receptor plug domain-containing protein [Sphaerochaetaceae bacterium]